ncbi:plasmid pRiA4b ORF-3 family protein [Streptosporangium saharense]|uniref:plasmid pRiA4b ORF-3 family protein n=1 Tax=Streptosporangium saharense TaxID=1706840 RepID=UPI00332B6C67
MIRRRYGKMPHMVSSRTAPSNREPVTVHRIKVTLAGSRPPIWRRLEVPSEITLRALHDILQAVFGWEDYHMWAFESPHGRYGVADRELQIADAATRRLGQIAAEPGDRLGYTYDFGDNWEHVIAVEAVTPAEPGVAYPRCLTGRRACPPEDCGGIWGYDDLMEILADPEHEEHEERLEWLGLDSADQFDPAAFDLSETNAALSHLVPVIKV